MASTTVPAIPPLLPGQKLTREEFLRRWEALPDLKNAELIEGIVYMPSPVSAGHSRHDSLLIGWLSMYAWHTQTCECGNNGTWLMLESAPQPDAHLRILPEHGGQSRQEGTYFTGAPELAVEICAASVSHDLGPKLALYQRAGVREYITVELGTPRVTWRTIVEGSYKVIEPGADGIPRSKVFPGLWLDPDAVLSADGARMNAVLQAGLAAKCT